MTNFLKNYFNSYLILERAELLDTLFLSHFLKRNKTVFMVSEQCFILPKDPGFHTNITICWILRILLLRSLEALGCIFTITGIKMVFIAHFETLLSDYFQSGGEYL